MAFSFGGSPFGSGGAGGNAQGSTELEEIQTDSIGFLALNGEAKVKLLPSAWPTDNLPPPTSSLLSVASNKGLLAAAGPESVVVARTESVRSAFESAATDGDYRAFAPELTIPIGTRISQVSFSSDGNLLVLSAETGGGLAIYETSGLLQGNTKSSFELATNGASVRALSANPNVASGTGELFAVVTVKGELMIANMSSRQFVNGASGQVFREGVSSVSWSNKGKQLAAGLGNGTIVQLKPDGSVAAEIPAPPGLDGEQHVSSLSWLENDVFLVAHTPSAGAPPGDLAPPTTYHIITRHANAPFSFSKLPEVCSPFGLNRSPAMQFFQRLRNFPPSLKDVVLVASTASQDIGLFTNSEKPLTGDIAAKKIVNLYTTTAMATDSRRAALPMSEDMVSDTSPIGLGIDLSSTSKVSRPIPSDELDWTQGPLPAMFVLNNAGALCAWWIVYSDSVKQGLTFPGISAAQGQPITTPSQPSAPAFGSTTAATSTPSQLTFGQSAFGQSSSLGGQSPFGGASSSTSAFGSATKPSTPAFGSGTAFGASAGGGSAFGSTGGLGNKSSPWGSTNTAQATPTASPQPAFGSTSSLGMGSAAKPAFGSSGGLGQNASPWATPSAPGGSAFGQVSGLGQKPAFGTPTQPSSGFASATPASSASSGFASFATSGGFAAKSSETPKAGGDSIFKQSSTPSAFGGSVFGSSSFGKNTDTANPFGQKTTAPNPFGQPATAKKDTPPSATFGTTTEPFKVRSSWTNPDAGKGSEKPTKSIFEASDKPKQSFFGDTFGKALGDTTKDTSIPESKEEDMASGNEDTTKPQSPTVQAPETTTPADTPAANKFSTAPPASGGFFTSQTQSKDTPVAEVQKSQPTFPLFGRASSSTDEQKNKPAPSIFDKPAVAIQSPGAEQPKIKEEPKDEDDASKVDKDIPAAPLPPDTTSKATYTPGTSSTSSMAASKTSADDAPLPPDFVQPSSKPKSQFSFDTPSLPPSFAPTVAKGATNEPLDAPLPPDFVPTKPKSPAPPAGPLPGSPPDSSSSSSGSPSLTEKKENGGLDDEGSGVDVAQELSPTTDQSPKVTPESSFGQKLDKSPLGGSFQKINQPMVQQPTKSLFGELGTSPAPFFPPPSRTQQSPRSPSPVRRALGGDFLRPDNARSVSAPGVPRGDGARKVTLGRPVPDNLVYPPQKSAEEKRREERELQARLKAQIEADERQQLSDDEADQLRRELESEVEPVKELASFVAHENYSGNVSKEGIAGEIEKVYRDINSMVDILGINSRSVKAWIKGNEELVPYNGRDREDLENPSDWYIDEVQSLSSLQEELNETLAQGQLRDVPGKLAEIRELNKKMTSLKARLADTDAVIKLRNDPEQQAALYAAKLPAEHEVQRRETRQAYAAFQTQLETLEKALITLRAALATFNTQNSKQNGPRRAPTFEAIENTIRKMTKMAETKSGDLDLLEIQMRKLGVNGSASASREGSPFVTPPTSARKGRAQQLQRFGTPSSSLNGGAFHTPQSTKGRFGDSVRSTGSALGKFNGSVYGKSSRKKFDEVGADEASEYAAKAARRRQMQMLLKDALVGGEVRIRTLDDI